MKYRVLFGAKAKKDILSIYSYIAEKAEPETAEKYIARIERWCTRLETFPQRGVNRDDIRKGMRIGGFERRVSIGFYIKGDTVRILRVLYGGRDLSRIDFTDDDVKP